MPIYILTGFLGLDLSAGKGGTHNVVLMPVWIQQDIHTGIAGRTVRKEGFCADGKKATVKEEIFVIEVHKKYSFKRLAEL